MWRPTYLGFDFNVRKEQVEEMKKFIELTLNEFSVPLVDLYVSGIADVNEKNVGQKRELLKLLVMMQSICNMRLQEIMVLLLEDSKIKLLSNLRVVFVCY